MNRTRFVQNLLGAGLLTAIGCKTENTPSPTSQMDSSENQTSSDRLRQELMEAWDSSEKMTMTNVEQMPPDFFTYKYTEEAMTFSEQWRHCVIYTCGQLAGRAGIRNPYEGIKLPIQMSKGEVIKELKNMYKHVRESIANLPEEKLLSNCDFAGQTIPVWRLFYAMENHIIHHRGQCIVYLRINGIVPKGYYGW